MERGGLPHFFTGKERGICSWTRPIEDLVHMIVSGLPVCCACCPVQGHHSLVVLISDRRFQGIWKIDAHPPDFPRMLPRVRSGEVTLVRKCVRKSHICVTRVQVLQGYNPRTRQRPHLQTTTSFKSDRLSSQPEGFSLLNTFSYATFKTLWPAWPRIKLLR